MTIPNARNLRAIDSFEGNSVVMNIRRDYYSVYTPTSNWAKAELMDACFGDHIFDARHMQQQAQRHLSERGFAAVEVVPLRTQKGKKRNREARSGWVLQDYWNQTDPQPAAKQIYSSVGDALEAARAWYQENTGSREVILSKNLTGRCIANNVNSR